jgi:hypothetical protein
MLTALPIKFGLWSFKACEIQNLNSFWKNMCRIKGDGTLDILLIYINRTYKFWLGSLQCVSLLTACGCGVAPSNLPRQNLPESHHRSHTLCYETPLLSQFKAARGLFCVAFPCHSIHIYIHPARSRDQTRTNTNNNNKSIESSFLCFRCCALVSRTLESPFDSVSFMPSKFSRSLFSRVELLMAT